MADANSKTLLNADDIFQLLQGKVLFRESSGARATPASGDTFTGRHAIEIALDDGSLETVRNYLSPEVKDVVTKSDIRPAT